MCSMPEVAPILVTYFAAFELWTEIYLLKIGIFFHGRLLAIKGDIYT